MASARLTRNERYRRHLLDVPADGVVTRQSARDDLTLHYNFAQLRSLEAALTTPSLGPTLGITRTTDKASFYDAAGVLQNAGAGVARFDHLPISPFTSLGLLVEEARTNLCLQSEDFSTTWGVTNASISTDAVTAPDGTTTADKLVEASDTAKTHFVDQAAFNLSNITYTATVYVEPAERTAVRFVFTDNVVASFEATFTLTGSGSIRVSPSDTGNWTNTSASIDPIAGGRYRIVLIGTLGVGQTNCALQLFTDNGSTSTYDGDGSSGLYLWGAQLEAGAFPTSYIPTTTVGVARNADIVTTADVTWFNATAGTFYSAVRSVSDDQGSGIILEIDDNSTSDRIFHNLVTGTGAQHFIVAASATQTSPTIANNYLAGKLGRMATCYAANDGELFADGVRSGTGDQTITLPTGLSHFFVGSRVSAGNQNNVHVDEIRYYNVRKDNQFLQDLSAGNLPIVVDPV